MIAANAGVDARVTGTVLRPFDQAAGVSRSPAQRAVAALLGATAVWRVLSGVAAIVRWLWVGERLGNGSMSVLLVSVVVGPIVGAVGGDAALRRGFWSASRPATRRRLATLLALLFVPFLATRAVGLLVRPVSLPLHGLVTLVATGAVLLVGFSGRDE